MSDSRDKPELETLDYKPPGTIEQPTSAPPAFMGFNSAVIKPETRVNKAEDAGQHLEQPKCKTCEDTREIEEQAECGNTILGDCPECQPDQPNQNLMIIEEIEGLMSQVNDKLYLINNGLNSLKLQGLKEKHKALEEIDLFQKNTLFKLRKAFE